MTLARLREILEGTGYPVTYRAWPERQAPALPFICFLSNGDEPLFADSSMYYGYTSVRVELYTANKEPETEAKVEIALCDFHWKKSETYIATERCYMIIYEIEV